MRQFPKLSEEFRLERLSLPSRPARMVLDTDAYNEIDDQFAISYAFLSSEQLAVEAIYSAPFHHRRVSGPAEGLELSHEEIIRVIDKIGLAYAPTVQRGSDRFIGEGGNPVVSAAAEDIIERAMSSNRDPLYVVSIGAPTNVASAILLKPEIIENVVVVWLGGHPYHEEDASEFNLRQDLTASRILFDSGVPLVNVPCKQVAELLCTTSGELNANLLGKNAIGDYLCDIFSAYCEREGALSRPLWDVAAVAYLVNPKWLRTKIHSSPTITNDLKWEHDSSRHQVRVVTYLERDNIFRDLFHKLQK